MFEFLSCGPLSSPGGAVSPALAVSVGLSLCAYVSHLRAVSSGRFHVSFGHPALAVRHKLTDQTTLLNKCGIISDYQEQK